jgi:hypothetical protein
MGLIHVRLALLAFGTAVLSSGFACPGARAAEHTLMPSPQTVHIGNFNAANKPVLTIDSGDIARPSLLGATGIDQLTFRLGQLSAQQFYENCSYSPRREGRETAVQCSVLRNEPGEEVRHNEWSRVHETIYTIPSG